MIWTYVIIILLLALSGIFSGLNLGLMGLNTFALERKSKIGNKYAKRLYPLRKKGNLLLCTLLLGNVAVNAVLAVFLGSITIGVIAVLVSTVLIVIFGEILPQALFSRFAMRFGARTTWIVYPFLVILYPIAKPMAMILDKMLGKELPAAFSKREIELILEEQKDHHKSDIDAGDLKILKGGLKFSDKLVKNVMTPKKNVFSLRASQKLTASVIERIYQKGHSRVPVLSDGKVVGVLYSKDVLHANHGNVLVSSIMRNDVPFVRDDDPLDNVLDLFKQKRRHLFTVLDFEGNLLGIITLEDVLEEIVGEIVDEHDQVVDMRTMDK